MKSLDKYPANQPFGLICGVFAFEVVCSNFLTFIDQVSKTNWSDIVKPSDVFNLF